MSFYIATTVNGREYVVLVDGKVVAGPFATAAGAVKARKELVEAGTKLRPVANPRRRAKPGLPP